MKPPDSDQDRTPYCECFSIDCHTCLPISWDQYHAASNGGMFYVVIPSHVPDSHENMLIAENHGDWALAKEKF